MVFRAAQCPVRINATRANVLSWPCSAPQMSLAQPHTTQQFHEYLNFIIPHTHTRQIGACAIPRQRPSAGHKLATQSSRSRCIQLRDYVVHRGTWARQMPPAVSRVQRRPSASHNTQARSLPLDSAAAIWRCWTCTRVHVYCYSTLLVPRCSAQQQCRVSVLCCAFRENMRL